MIKAATIYTLEMDDGDAALDELRAQLDEKITLQAHSVGIIQCRYDFVESGVVETVCKGLPFPVVGMTSTGQVVNGMASEFMLSIMVLTGDDVSFETAHTTGHADDFEGSIAKSLPARDDVPKLAIIFPAIQNAVSGDRYCEAFISHWGAVPVFGSYAIEDGELDNMRFATLCNGESFTDELTYIAVYGNVNPKFHIMTATSSVEMYSMGLITKADGNVLRELNGLRAMEYFEREGFAHDGVMREGIHLMLYKLVMPNINETDEDSFARAVVGFDDEGSAIFRGEVYEGAHLFIGNKNVSDIMEASKQFVDKLNAIEGANAVLVFSCIVHHIFLAATPELELQTACERMRDEVPFMGAYSGGEICPTSTTAGGATNRYHNFSFVACTL